MKKCIILIFLLASASISFSQELNKKTMDAKSEKEILIGYCTLDSLKTGDFGESFNDEWQWYEVDTMLTKKIKNKISDVSIIIVLGTWCGDSKEQVPRFLKILEQIGYDASKIKLICVDRNKKAGDVMIDDLKVEKVPTFIFYRKNTEIGRIIEVPVDLLERDILHILSK